MRMHRMGANKEPRGAWMSSRPAPCRRAAVVWGIAAVLLMVTTVAAAAAKPPQQIRKHLLERADKPAERVSSIEPVHGEALDDLVDVQIWQVEYRREGEDGTYVVFMAVKDGAVLRIRGFDKPGSRDNLVGLLRDDFRVTSKNEAAELVSATLSLHSGFPFGEPEKTAEEMRFEKRDGEYFFVDGERFGDATGYRIAIDGEGRVTSYEYSWELPVQPPGEE